MAFQFPASPAVNQTFTPVAGTTYRWSGTAWHLLAGPGAFITQAEGDARYVNVDEAQNTTNRIINGKFAIDQRNAGGPAVIVATGGFVVDRWSLGITGSGRSSGNREADALYGGEFRLKIGVTTTDAAPAAGSTYNLLQGIEGSNCAGLNWGTAQAAPITLAFEIESSLTGTYAICIVNGAANRSYPASFTVTTANTREAKVVTIPGDVTGTWPTDNTVGMYVILGLGAGSTFTGTPNTWQAGNIQSVTGAVNFMASTANQLRLRNVRLYKGAVDFGPDRRLYAEELALCQRYYHKTFAQGTAPASAIFPGAIDWQQWSAGAATVYFSYAYPVVMRVVPTVTFYNPINAGNQAVNGNTSVDCTGTSFLLASESRGIISAVTAASSASGNQISVQLTASSEL